jgi:hypothetical protein
MCVWRYDTKILQIMLARAGLEVVSRPKYAEHMAVFELGPVFAVRKIGVDSWAVSGGRRSDLTIFDIKTIEAQIF